MPIHNTDRSYGGAARALHWLTAALILTTFPLGLWAESLPWGSGEELAFKAQVFSIHKTLGIAAFFTGLVRILWAIVQTVPGPARAARPAEHWLAGLVHWLLYTALILVPLSGWVHHAATEGFAPILWPLGQGLPLVPKAEWLAHATGLVHVVATKVLLGSVVLHVAGALKHAVIDRDGTLSRMVTGRPAGDGTAAHASGVAFAALALWGAVVGSAVALSPAPQAPVQAVAEPAVSNPVVASGNWQVEEGALAISVRQMGSVVKGAFGTWRAAITFDPDRQDGNRVEVVVDTGSLTLGSVSQQAVGPDFLNAAAHPEAVFSADILREGEAWLAQGTLDLNGATVPVALPFTLEIDGDLAQMQGEVRIDRRAFGIGQTYGDEATVGFEVVISVELAARRQE